MTSASDEKWRLSNRFFSVQVTGGSLTGPDPEIRVGDQDIGSGFLPVHSGLQVAGEAGHCHARTRPHLWTSRGVFPSEVLQLHQQGWLLLRVDRSIPLEGNQWKICRLDPTKSRRNIFQGIFALGIFWGRVGWAAMPTLHRLLLFLVSRSRISEIIPNVAGTTIDVFHPHSGNSGPTSRRASACPNIHEWLTQPAHVRWPVAQLLF